MGIVQPSDLATTPLARTTLFGAHASQQARSLSRDCVSQPALGRFDLVLNRDIIARSPARPWAGGESPYLGTRYDSRRISISRSRRP